MTVSRIASRSTYRRLAAAAGLLASVPAPLTAQTGDATHIAHVAAGLRPLVTVKGTPSVTWSLAERMAHYKVPGVSVAVVEGGQLAWAKGFGLKETGTTDSVTPVTLFQAASISKPVAATATLRLVQDGKLALDTPVNAYLRSWTLPGNRFTAKAPVTLRLILSHGAGLTVHGFDGYATGEPVPTVPQVLDGVKPANSAPVRVDTFPGARWNYSGGGITIEQLAVTDVTGEPFPAVARRLVLGPIGMDHSTYEQPLPQALRGQEAAGYRPDGSMVVGRWHTYPEMAAAGLWTTPTDLLKWAMEITAARAGRSTKVLSQAMAKEMLTVQTAPSGLGPFLNDSGLALRFGHGGANEGFRGEVVYFPELGRGAAVMTNSDAGSPLVQEILYAIAKEYDWPATYGPREVTPLALDAAVLDRYVGLYDTTSPQELHITVTRDARGLVLSEARYVPPTAVLLLSPTRVISPETGLELTFGLDANGAPDRIELGDAVLRKRAR